MKRQTFENDKYYVYILYSKKDTGLYVGYSSDLRKRIGNHTRGEVTSTKHRRPLILIHYEFFVSKKDAMAREKYLKSGYGHEQIRSILKDTLGK